MTNTITVTVTSDVPSSTGTFTETFTFTQADMATFLAALEGSTATATAPDATSAWFGKLRADIVLMVTRWQENQALSAIVPIAPS